MNYLKLIMAALLLACLLHMPYGFYVQREEEQCADGDVRGTGPAVPAVFQDSIGARHVECRGCGCGHTPRCALHKGEEKRVIMR